MSPTRRQLLAGTGAAVVAGALPAAAQADDEARAQRFIDAVAEEQLQDGPEQASSLGIDTGARAALRSRLADRSPEGVARAAGHVSARLAEVKAFDGARVSPTMRINLDVIRDSFASATAGFAQPYGDVAVGGWRNSPYVVIQNVGAFLDVPRLLDSTHKVESKADADAYLARMTSYARQLDGETERVKAATGKGAIPPDFLLDKALGQLRQTRSGEPAKWDICTSLAKRASKFGGGYDARAAKIAAAEIAPALDRQIAALEAQRARATSDAGVWHLPDGEGYYAWALAAGTTTRMTPDEVHRRGLDELAELQARMDTILKGVGYTRGTVGERMTALGKDPKYLFPDNDAGRAEIVALLNTRISAMRAKMPRAFRTLVSGRFEVKRLPLAEEPGAPGAYGGAGTVDGSVPGRMWINLRTTRLHSRFSLPDLAYHEAIPGHIWQGEYTFKLPLIRSILAFNAYSEGWALYAQQLAEELGAYDGNPVERLGYLQGLAFRACRLVVDTGLHARRWTRARAIEWFATTNGSGLDEVTSEVDRYCSWPGQACGYKIGHSEIVRLRGEAQRRLGDRYDLRDFDDAVITAGGVPMTVLGSVVERYVSGKAA